MGKSPDDNCGKRGYEMVKLVQFFRTTPQGQELSGTVIYDGTLHFTGEEGPSQFLLRGVDLQDEKAILASMDKASTVFDGSYLRALVIDNVTATKGAFVTIDDRVVFVGGPGQGGGGGTSQEVGIIATTDESRWDQARRYSGETFDYAQLQAGEEFVDKNGKEWRDSLTPEDLEALEFYSYYGYRPMNSLLRDGEFTKVQELQSDNLRTRTENYWEKQGISAEEVSSNLDEFKGLYLADTAQRINKRISEYRLEEDVVVFRGLRASLSNLGLETGSVWEDKGFVSTSLLENTARKFTDYNPSNSIMEIRLPKGTPVGLLNGISYGHSESEILLSAGTQFKVISRTGNRAVLEVVP